MFKKLFDEVDVVREAFPEFGFLEALGWIRCHIDEFDSEVREEIDAFFAVGAEFFAEV